MYSDNCVTGFSASVVVVVTAGRAASAPLHARMRPFISPSLQPCTALLAAGCCLLPAGGWMAGWMMKGLSQRKVGVSASVMKVHDYNTYKGKSAGTD